MNKTKIEWVKNPDGTQGYTCSDKTGCLNGCPYCYARKLANGWLKSLYLANKNYIGLSDIDSKTDPFYPRHWPERLEQIRKHKKPIGIFLDDMSDWMGDYWPKEWTEAEIQVMRDCPQHRFYTLTKQPQNLIKFSPFPDNCWVGVTATNQHQFDIALAWLAQIEAKLTYISIEPHLEHIKVSPTDLRGLGFKLGWLIDGAQTKPYKSPKIEWVEEIVRACDKAGIPVFLKDTLRLLIPPKEPLRSFLKYPDETDIAGGVWKLRQEMPNG